MTDSIREISKDLDKEMKLVEKTFVASFSVSFVGSMMQGLFLITGTAKCSAVSQSICNYVVSSLGLLFLVAGLSSIIFSLYLASKTETKGEASE